MKTPSRKGEERSIMFSQKSSGVWSVAWGIVSLAFGLGHTCCLAAGLEAVSGLAVSAATGADGQWGTLKGRFLYDGKVPGQKKLNISKDVEVCSKHTPMDESLVVDADGGLANVTVYIRPKRGSKIKVHPDYAKTQEDKVVLTNNSCRFEPHLTLMRTTQTLTLKNEDPVGHNTKADFFKASSYSFNQQIPSGGSVDMKVERAEGRPVPVQCNIHPWMQGYLLVRADPYMAVSGADGSFTIENIPVGTYEFQFWQEKAGYLKGIEFAGGKANKKGRAKVKIKAGENSLGDVKVSAKLFQKK